MSQDLLLIIESGIATLTLNRLQVGNAFDSTFFTQVIDCLTDLGQNDDVKVILLNANGKVFSAGGDIHLFQETIDSQAPFDFDFCMKPGKLAATIRACPKPVIALVKGPAAGAEFGMVMACDYRIIGESVKLVPAFNGMGLPGDTGLFYFLGKHTGPTKTYEYFTLNLTITALEELQLGIVNKVVLNQDLDQEGLAFANDLLNTPLKVLAMQKEWTNRLLYPDLSQALDFEAIGTHISSGQPAFFTAVAAFFA